MSLNWDVRKVKDWKALADDPIEKGITDAVVFACMAYSLRGVTEKNIDEWLYRQEFNRRVDDYYPCYRGAERSVLTRAELERRIGLDTNVTNLTRTMFEKIVMEKVRREVAAALKRA